MTDSLDANAGHRPRVDARAALLVALAAGQASGFELMGRIRERSAGTWKPSATVVYPTLQQLEDEALAVSCDVDGKRVYTITAAGEAAVRQSIVDGHDPWPQPDIALRRELLRAVGVYTLAAKRFAGTAGPEQISAAIEITRRARDELLAALRVATDQ